MKDTLIKLAAFLNIFNPRYLFYLMGPTATSKPMITQSSSRQICLHLGRESDPAIRVPDRHATRAWFLPCHDSSAQPKQLMAIYKPSSLLVVFIILVRSDCFIVGLKQLSLCLQYLVGQTYVTLQIKLIDLFRNAIQLRNCISKEEDL